MTSQNHPVYFLRYLNVRGRGEPVRWLLAVAGAKYNEERISFTDWPTRKSGFDWGVVPVLEVNGVQLHQTLTICRYLSKVHKMGSCDNWEAARIEEIVESVHELSSQLGASFRARFTKNVDQVPELLEKAKTSALAVIERVEKTVSDEGWIRSKTMTWCDIVVACYFDIFGTYFPDITENCPKMHNLIKTVKNLPAMQSWLNSRPPLSHFEEKF